MGVDVIDRFSYKENGRWVHLIPSNGYIEPDGSFVEREYQAFAKTTDKKMRARILACKQPFGPLGSKNLGRHAPLRIDHEIIKFQVMSHYVTKKFWDHPMLADWLLGTDKALLVEGNTWHDNIWGNCTCGSGRCIMEGRNWLGLILMTVRSGLEHA